MKYTAICKKPYNTIMGQRAAPPEVNTIFRLKKSILIIKFVVDQKMMEMNLQKAKIHVMQKIMSVSKASLLDKINNILDEEMTVGYTTDGQPLTKSQYNERLLIAEKQIESGDYISQEDLENEIEKW